MKTIIIILVAICISVQGTFGQTPSTPAPKLFNNDRLEKLLGPIALYPDPLIAIILPASTEPDDIQHAAKFIRDGGDTAKLDSQPWDQSVRSLCHYPEILKWMDDNMEWTLAVGEAFRVQQSDVMGAIQRLRIAAHDAGNLESTPQQRAVVEEHIIRIVPAKPDVIYVPYYDPGIIFLPRRESFVGPMIVFGFGWRVGAWLLFGCDWHSHHVWLDAWRPGWEYRRGWGQPWKYDEHRVRPRRGLLRYYNEPPHPRWLPGTPPRPASRPPGLGRSGKNDTHGWGATPPYNTKRNAPRIKTHARVAPSERRAIPQRSKSSPIVR